MRIRKSARPLTLKRRTLLPTPPRLEMINLAHPLPLILRNMALFRTGPGMHTSDLAAAVDLICWTLELVLGEFSALARALRSAPVELSAGVG